LIDSSHDQTAVFNTQYRLETLHQSILVSSNVIQSHHM